MMLGTNQREFVQAFAEALDSLKIKTQEEEDWPTKLKLYRKPNEVDLVALVGFASDSDAEDFAMRWSAKGGSVAWAKCGHR